jgi:hypothetical protein
MKIFVAYGSNGEDPQVVKPALMAIQDTFKTRGVEIYSTFFDASIKKSLGAHRIVQHVLRVIDGSDILFVIQTSDNKSEGMLIEVGYSLAKKIPIIVATNSIVTGSYLPEIASRSFKWNTIADLRKAITSLEL